jgi:hypothetical protein
MKIEIIFALTAIAAFTGCATKNDAVARAARADETTGRGVPGLLETKAIAEEAFIYGLPIVMNYAIMNEFCMDTNSSQYKGPFNTLFHEHRTFTYRDTAVVTPNSDTPYSFIWLDLRAEPMVLTVPAVAEGRYYSIQLVDGNTFNYGYIGTRATGNAAGDYLIVGPDWKGVKPPGIKQVFRSSTAFAFSIYRTQLFNAADMPNVEKIQAGYQAQPLSAYLHQPAPPAAPKIDFLPASTAGIKENFFAYLDFALQGAPPGPEELAIRAKLARIGIGAGRTFDFADLDLEHKIEVGLGMRDGEAKIKAAVASLGKNVNFWRVSSAQGDRAFFHGDWLRRAAGAMAGIYGNDSIEATYPMSRWDINGAPLDGRKHDYTLTFPAGQLPPVNAFWSVTMYDGKSQLLIENPINRYLINSSMLPDLKKNADGSITLYIQNRSPGADKESNWLPAPAGPIYMVMRLYWPKTEAPSILPPGEGTWKPPGILKVD